LNVFPLTFLYTLFLVFDRVNFGTEAFSMSGIIGFIGLGNMGTGIAMSLIRAGHKLRVYNRTASKASPLVAQGATLVPRPSEVAERGGIVITMLSDDAALEEIALRDGAFLKTLSPGGIHISMSTVSPALARRSAAHHAGQNVGYVSAPVFGRPEAAAAAKLWVCVSGEAAAKKRVHPILSAISQTVFDFGDEPGAANVVKLCGNFLLFAAVEAMAEAAVLADKNGVNRKDMLNMLTQTVFACPVYQGYGQRLGDQKYEAAGFRLSLALKDINLALDTAESSAVPMPFASLLHDRWLSAVANGRENMDATAAALNVAEAAGIKVKVAAT
jgi:3-hydroxyisobutyrate dehydrogenase-like beta-hydroxyacid dehydrogenase